MPVFLNGQGPTKPAVPAKTLSKIYPLLTGRPSSVIGWFSSANTNLHQKFESITGSIDALRLKNNGDMPQFTSDTPSYEAIEYLLKLTSTKNEFLLEANVQGLYSTFDIYVIGFDKLTTRIMGRQSNFLVPVIAMKNTSTNDNTIIDSSYFDPNVYSYAPTDSDLIEAISNIEMQSLYDHLINFYYATNMRNLLTNMPSIAKSKGLSDKNILMAYTLLKHYLPQKPFNAVQLGAFVKELTINSADKALLSQQLLQFPELTFASLSEQFEAQSKIIPSL